MASEMQLCGGDAAALGELFERHVDAVYNCCFRQTASWSEAEQLTSLVFLEAWRKRDGVDVEAAALLPWLLAVASNVVRNAQRARRRYGRLLARLPEPMTACDFGDESAARADDERQVAAVLGVMRSLRPQEQAVVYLCDWAGLSQAEAALGLGIPAGTVRSRLGRAHEHLRAQLTLASAAGPHLPSTTRAP